MLVKMSSGWYRKDFDEDDLCEHIASGELCIMYDIGQEEEVTEELGLDEVTIIS